MKKNKHKIRVLGVPRKFNKPFKFFGNKGDNYFTFGDRIENLLTKLHHNTVYEVEVNGKWERYLSNTAPDGNSGYLFKITKDTKPQVFKPTLMN